MRRLLVRLEDGVVYLILLAAAAFSLIPILWSASTSLKLQETIFALPPRWWPDPLSIKNYVLVLLGSNMPRYFLNSVIVTVATLAVTLFAGALGGYAAARYEFRGKRIILFLILAAVMIPGVVVLVPLYLMSSWLGIHDTYFVLVVVYAAWQTPFVLWLMRGFVQTLPKELEESASVDGCSWAQMFVRIVLPLTRPGLAAAAVVVFVWVWNEFILAFTLTSSDNMRVITNGLYLYIGAFGVEWGKMMAATIVSVIPEIVIFVLLERSFVKGLTYGAMKG